MKVSIIEYRRFVNLKLSKPYDGCNVLGAPPQTPFREPAAPATPAKGDVATAMCRVLSHLTGLYGFVIISQHMSIDGKEGGGPTLFLMFWGCSPIRSPGVRSPSQIM